MNIGMWALIVIIQTLVIKITEDLSFLFIDRLEKHFM